MQFAESSRSRGLRVLGFLAASSNSRVLAYERASPRATNAKLLERLIRGYDLWVEGCRALREV